MTQIRNKFRLPYYSLTIKNGPDMESLVAAALKGTTFTLTLDVNGIGVKCTCKFRTFGYQDAFGNVIDIPDPSTTKDFLLFGEVTVLSDKENDAEIRAFEYYSPTKRTGELLERGGRVFLRGHRKRISEETEE